MSKSDKNHHPTAKTPRQGIDLLLQRKGKVLQTGQKISFTLIKGPSINREGIADPVNPPAPKEYFPLVAKFPESVVRPDFTKSQWSDARLYQQDVPKAHVSHGQHALVWLTRLVSSYLTYMLVYNDICVV